MTITIRILGTWCLPLLLTLISCGSPDPPTAPSGTAQSDGWIERSVGGISFRHADADTALVTSMAPVVAAEVSRVAGFLGLPVPQPYSVVVWPDRPRFEDRFRIAWQSPNYTPPCWLIAFALASSVELIPPRIWECGHPASSAEYLRLLLAHELTHLVHAQQPGSGYGLPVHWFMEGLAVYASGQLDAQYAGVAHARFAQGFTPASLPALMTDEAAYPLAGDLVRFIDTTWGRATLRSLTQAGTNAAVLAVLNETETNLLARWRAAAGF